MRVHLEADCSGAESCPDAARRTFDQFDVPKYSLGVSAMLMPGSIAEWDRDHRTARKRAARARRLGYRFGRADWSRYPDDIHAINTSLPERQGRPMDAAYLERRDRGPLPEQPCPRHMTQTYGVLRGEQLVAYLDAHRVGELVIVSMILGHGAHVRNDVMYLLMRGLIADQIDRGGVLFYNRHDSGTDGLRYFKDRIGFRPEEVEWALA